MKKIVPLFIFSALFLNACTVNTQANVTSTLNPTATSNLNNLPLTSPTPLSTPAENNSADADYTITMANYSFTPNIMQVNAGETIKVKIIGQDMLHDLIIDELDVKSVRLNAGEEAIVNITAPDDASGKSYEFYCSVGDHRQRGMVGTLTIK